MDQPAAPLRCPHCNALVVDRRFSDCTTCRQPLPADWIISKVEADKLKAADQKLKANHAAEMRKAGGQSSVIDILTRDVRDSMM